MSASTTGICCMAFFFTMGILMVVLGCALPEYDNWYPLFVLITYILTPIPACAITRGDGGYGDGTGKEDAMIFMTAALTVSGYGIPFVLYNNAVIAAGAAWLTIAGNTVIFSTTLAYFLLYEVDDGYGHI
mmetsp:Transcript_15838/g.40929  ORF Transcript_15838/g.40929 Transcript_15838/m.40929 type:complete len:130 (+) Transcript_15838:68-457(+)